MILIYDLKLKKHKGQNSAYEIIVKISDSNWHQKTHG